MTSEAFIRFTFNFRVYTFVSVSEKFTSLVQHSSVTFPIKEKQCIESILFKIFLFVLKIHYKYIIVKVNFQLTFIYYQLFTENGI